MSVSHKSFMFLLYLVIKFENPIFLDFVLTVDHNSCPLVFVDITLCILLYSGAILKQYVRLRSSFRVEQTK